MSELIQQIVSYIGMCVPINSQRFYIRENLKDYRDVFQRDENFEVVSLDSFLSFDPIKKLFYLNKLKDHEIF